MNAAQVFNPRLVVGLIAAGIVGFAAMLLLMAYGGNPGSRSDGRAHALSSAATGYRGLVTLVGRFSETRYSRSLDDEGDDLLVVAVEEQTADAEVERLLGRRANLPTLLILPKWLTMPDPSRRGWVNALGPGTGDSAEGMFGKDTDVRVLPAGQQLPPHAQGDGFLGGLAPPLPRSPQVIGGPQLTPLVTVPGGSALLAQIGDQPHYVLADPDLVNNHGLRDPDRARFALALIDRLNEGGESVAFDLTMNGFGRGGGSGNVLRMAFEPPFLALTLALVAAALLAGLHGAFRFGAARQEARAIAFGKAALVENSAGLIRQADREANLGAAYADVVRYEAARTTAAPHWLQGEALDRYLDRLSRPGQPRFSELAARLAQARDRHRLMAAARALSEWKRGIIR